MDWSICLLQLFTLTKTIGSGETMQMRRFAETFAIRNFCNGAFPMMGFYIKEGLYALIKLNTHACWSQSTPII